MRLRNGNDPGPVRERSASRRRGRILFATLLATAATFEQAGGALALTAREQFLGALGKVAPFAPAKAKRLCRCTHSSDVFIEVAVGELRAVIVSSNGTEDYGVTCQVPSFNPTTGAVASTRACTDNKFEILPK